MLYPSIFTTAIANCLLAFDFFKIQSNPIQSILGCSVLFCYVLQINKYRDTTQLTFLHNAAIIGYFQHLLFIVYASAHFDSVEFLVMEYDYCGLNGSSRHEFQNLMADASFKNLFFSLLYFVSKIPDHRFSHSVMQQTN